MYRYKPHSHISDDIVDLRVSGEQKTKLAIAASLTIWSP